MRDCRKPGGLPFKTGNPAHGHSLNAVSARFHAGELVGIVGPNGAGKSTLLKALAGLIPRGGLVTLDGEYLPEKTHQIVRAGVALVAEGRAAVRADDGQLVSSPRLPMLDEPSLGLAPKMVDELLATARRIADAGTTVLMVEQNVKKALAVADRGYVLERGALVASGAVTLLARSSVVREAHLGTADAAQRRGVASAA